MNMCLFAILCVIAIVLIIITIAAVIAGGVGMILIFGDVIVCIAIIAIIVKLILDRKRKY